MDKFINKGKVSIAIDDIQVFKCLNGKAERVPNTTTEVWTEFYIKFILKTPEHGKEVVSHSPYYVATKTNKVSTMIWTSKEDRDKAFDKLNDLLSISL